MQDKNSKKLSLAKFPKMIGEMNHSVQFLKVFTMVTMMFAMVLLTSLAIEIGKEMPVVTLDLSGKVLQQGKLPKPENEIQEAVKYYLSKRYQWGPKDVVKKLKEAESFISPTSLKAFQGSVANVSRFSKEKIVTQKVYPDEIKVDLQKSKVLISGDRVTSIQGLKAAGDLKLELTFIPGSRTQENPWGVYITQEREE